VLEKALDTRKFEIDLYWKRATYFWAFIAAAFAGYFTIASSAHDNHEILIVLTCIGFVFSLGWFLANRGSKFWQENWEKHVDLLENQVYGPLYKTALDNRKFHLLRITEPFHFSVSRINQILSLFITFIWVFLASKEISTLLGCYEPFRGFNEMILGAITITSACYLIWGTKGGAKSNRCNKQNGEQEFFMISKTIKD
jgi:hypothetical protein